MLLSSVPIISQCTPSGGSALIGCAGRFTTRTVSEETKESSAIITAATQTAAAPGGVLPFLTSFYGHCGTKFPKTAIEAA
jgi:hypothetical protein